MYVGECTFHNGERQAWWDVQNVDLILQDSLFNLASSGTSIRDWSLNKGKPVAAGHITGQYRSKEDLLYVYKFWWKQSLLRQGTDCDFYEKSFVMWNFLLENVRDQTAVRKMWTWCVTLWRKKKFVWQLYDYNL